MTTLITIILIIVFLSYALPILLMVLFFYGLYRLILNIKKKRYFKSEEFLEHKALVDSMLKEYHEISEYARTIPNNNQFIYDEDVHQHSHLAHYENTSTYDYKRDRNVRYLSDNVYPASLHIVKRASEEPIKYLCKYFNIEANEKNLRQLEEIGNNISRMENTIENLYMRFNQIVSDFNPPEFIVKHFKDELLDQIGIHLPSIEPEYSEYIFEYVSPGGNSSQRTVILFDVETVEAVAEYISEQIKFRDSVAGQRALMTKAYREKIKQRDNYTCQMCGVSTEEQSLLLLEVDHIIPVSKGGKSVDDNLQTLCWKCNRTKSDKILAH